LSQYNLVVDEIINTSYLKTGLLFTILLVPILIILYLNFEEPTDNYLVAKKYFPTFLVNILTYLLMITMILIDYKKLTIAELVIFFIGLPIDLFTYFLATSFLFKDKKKSTKIIIQLIIPVIFLSYLGFKFPHLGFLYFIILLICQTFVLAIGVVADKKYSWGHYISQIISLVFISYLFGRFVYGSLPNYLGGGIPFSTTIIAKLEKNDFLKRIGFETKQELLYKVEILHISSDKYLIRSNKKIFFLNKDLFEGFITEYSVK
jgi:hypothetical protein